MSKDYQAIYAEKMAKQRQLILGSEIADEVELKLIGNTKLEAITAKISEITEKPVWEDYNFRAGKILGILRSIAQNPKKRTELLVATGLDNTLLDLYNKYAGNLPYINSTSNTINIGRKMDCRMTRQLLQVVAERLGVLLEENDLEDITDERWERLYKAALEKAAETSELNEKNKMEVNIGYEE